MADKEIQNVQDLIFLHLSQTDSVISDFQFVYVNRNNKVTTNRPLFRSISHEPIKTKHKTI